MPFRLLVKVKLSLLLLYDGKTVVFSGEHGSLSAFGYICMSEGARETGLAAGTQNVSTNEKILVMFVNYGKIIVILWRIRGNLCIYFGCFVICREKNESIFLYNMHKKCYENFNRNMPRRYCEKSRRLI